MTSLFTNLWISFLAGLAAPLTAVCVLPLYPGFLAYLANQLKGRESKRTIIFLGFNVAFGIIVSMLLIGLIFTFFLQESLTRAIGIISPIAFGVLAIISLLLIFNFNFAKLIPKVHTPLTKNPLLSSFLFGFFFGAIIIPCNPASLVVLFAISSSTVGFIANLLNFFLFAIGMSLPLLILAVVSAAKSQVVVAWLSKYNRIINLITGIIMLGISLYYLIFVFKILS